MTEKERLFRVIAGQSVDRPPCICPGGMMNMITTDVMDLAGVFWPEAHTDAEMMAALAAAGYENGCFENVGVPFCMTVEAEMLGAEVTMGTGIYEPHVTGYAINSVEEWRNLKPANLESGRVQTVIQAIRLLKARNLPAPVIGNLTGPISTASSLMEPVDFYKQLRKKNKEAHEFMNFVTEQMIHFVRMQLEAGADIIAVSDPSGTGEILGPRMFEEFAVKYLNQIVEAVHQENKPVIIHICGQMKNVYPQLRQLKSDVLSFDSIVPMSEARKNLPNRVLMGNVSTYALEFGNPEKIIKLTEHCVKNGSNIVSPACGLGTRSPLKNIQTMVSYLKGTASAGEQVKETKEA
ncbi:MAG: MtaA/CmuA family methyltransferase [Lachnospiraceae bacterium]|nr:MtaA/CmuA family methyltransferase [Lachnospiraceae bacterium]